MARGYYIRGGRLRERVRNDPGLVDYIQSPHPGESSLQLVRNADGLTFAKVVCVIGCTKSPCLHTRDEISLEEVVSDEATAPNGSESKGTDNTDPNADDAALDIFKMVGFYHPPEACGPVLIL